jgi:hypothetical protein
LWPFGSSHGKCIGNKLSGRLAERALVDEADTIYSGLIGWFVRRHLTHPPAGARLKNLVEFAREV